MSSDSATSHSTSQRPSVVGGVGSVCSYVWVRGRGERDLTRVRACHRTAPHSTSQRPCGRGRWK